MKYQIYSSLLVGLILTGCNAGSNQVNNPSKLPNQTAVATPKLMSGQVVANGNINMSIINNSLQILKLSVPDSNNLQCSGGSGPFLQNCGTVSGTNATINDNSQESFFMSSSVGIQAFGQETVSLSIYANNSPLFGVWQDGVGTPNPQNHYSSQYANNILEIKNWAIGNENNSSLFVGMGNSNGLIETSSYKMNSDGSINLTIVVSNNVNDKPFVRTGNSVASNSLCTTATASCPNTLKSVGVSNIVSNNGLYQLDMQSDGNLVIYNILQRPIWASNTVGTGATYLALGSDGNLGVYTPNGTSVWTTNSLNQGATYVTLGDDGNFAVYKSDGTPVWASNSAQN